jgi:hypothetical protein
MVSPLGYTPILGNPALCAFRRKSLIYKGNLVISALNNMAAIACADTSLLSHFRQGCCTKMGEFDQPGTLCKHRVIPYRSRYKRNLLSLSIYLEELAESLGFGYKDLSGQTQCKRTNKNLA